MKEPNKEELRARRQARGCLTIEDTRMGIKKKGETKYSGMNDSGRDVRESER